ncbi:DUF2513 domain-containing protein [Salmonella enterica]|nr:DUF2513 domain-containing protein [Salmonella enterica]EDK0373681.1 DUF2513 domain-containing protein [Salmonella enterica]EGK8508509.1 DUF2513 domain-containing protein [Salmonella enterica]
MQVELDEIKRMLNTFLEAPGPFITIKDLGFVNEEDEEKLDKAIGHFLLIVENGLISSMDLTTGDAKAVGLYLRPRNFDYVSTPIRLTQSGHDFINMLNQKPVFERLKEEAKEAPFSLLQKVGAALTEKLGLGN